MASAGGRAVVSQPAARSTAAASRHQLRFVPIGVETSPIPPGQPGNLTNFRRLLEKFCEFFEMDVHPKSSPSFSGLGAETAL